MDVGPRVESRTGDSIPAPVGRRVQRPRLVARIDASDRPLLLVVAPSGFGKTSVLSQWAAATSADVAWVSCREADNERTHFWSHLVGVCAGRWPAMGTDAALILRRPSWDDEILVAALGRDLTDVQRNAVIVLDDCQFVEPFHRALASLARPFPEGVLRLVMASQHNPALSTSRLRLDGVVDELRADELAFSPPEVAELLAMAGVELDADDQRRLHARTEGWPAGVQMAVLAMRGSGDPKAVVEAFAATTSETSDYLANEVIARLPADLTEFLARISVLEEFDADLCEAVTGERRARLLLERIIANDLFIYRLDLAGDRYRFHQMFAAYLRTLLKSQGDAAYRDAHRRAAEAMNARGDRFGALRHAMAIADIQRAASIVTDSIATILEVDDAPQAIAVARAWLGRFGADARQDNPEQYLQFAFLLATCGEREAERWMVAFDRAHPTPAPRIAAFAHATWANLNLNRGQAESALEHNRLAMDAAAQAAVEGTLFPELAELPLQAAGAHLLTGDLVAAGAVLDRRTPLLTSPIVDEVRSPAVRQWVLFLQGDLESAERLTRGIRGAAAEHDAVSHGVGLILADLVEACLHLEREEFDQAAVLLATARQGAQINGRPLVESIVERWIARLAIARQDRAGALAAVAQAGLVLAGPSDSVRAQLAVDEFRVCVELAPERADVIVPELPDDPTSRLLRARLALRRRDPTTARQILDHIGPVSIRDQVEWGVLSSLAYRRHDARQAHSHLAAALDIAQPHRYLATVIRSGSGVADLLRSMPTPARLHGYVQTLLHVADRVPQQPEVASRPDHGFLTSRERDVLRLLSSRLTSHEIAATLFISMNTLKSHMKSVYAKLHVNSRAEAVNAADAQNLL